MDNTSQNLKTAEPQVSNINYPPLPPQSPKVPAVKTGMKRNIIMVFSLILIVLVAAGILYFYFSKNAQTYNASLYVPPKTADLKMVPTPTPNDPRINKNDNSNKALNSDSDIINKDINSTNSDLDSVDQSFNDEQTNLQ